MCFIKYGTPSYRYYYLHKYNNTYFTSYINGIMLYLIPYESNVIYLLSFVQNNTIYSITEMTTRHIRYARTQGNNTFPGHRYVTIPLLRNKYLIHKKGSCTTVSQGINIYNTPSFFRNNLSHVINIFKLFL